MLSPKHFNAILVTLRIRLRRIRHVLSIEGCRVQGTGLCPPDCVWLYDANMAAIAERQEKCLLALSDRRAAARRGRSYPSGRSHQI